jgi:hypothetical protein
MILDFMLGSDDPVPGSLDQSAGSRRRLRPDHEPTS